MAFLRPYYDIRRLHPQSFYELGSRAIVYFRYSKRLPRDQYFYGVEVDDLGRYSEENAFLLFICGDETNVFTIPARTFYDMVEGSEAISGQWKVFIEHRAADWLLRIAKRGRFDITEFRNYFDFAPPLLKASSPNLGQFYPVRERDAGGQSPTEGEAGQEQPVELAALLVQAASESQRYVQFEDIVARALRSVGLEAHREGGAGNTDVVITGPFRAIVECKSTASASLSNANFVRIKRHMALHEASVAAVVGVKFDPGVQADAEAMNVALLEVRPLADLIRDSIEFPLPPEVFLDILGHTGLVPTEKWRKATASISTAQAKIARLSRVLDVLDFQERSVDELRGRLSSQSDKEYSANEVREAIDFLRAPLLDIAGEGSSGYKLKVATAQARTRMRAVLSRLATPLALTT